jgi:cytochrome P450
MMTQMKLQAFLESQEWRARPEKLYGQMVEQQVIRRPEGWYFTRYKDVSDLLNHPDFTNAYEGAPDDGPLVLSMLQKDAPDHGRLRSTVTPVLNKKPVADMETALSEVIVSRMPNLEGHMEFMSEVASQLPLWTFQQIFNLSDKEQAHLAACTNRYINRAESLGVIEEVQRLQAEDLLAIRKFYAEIFPSAANRNSPTLGRLVAAVSAGGMTMPEALEMCVILTIGGMETTTNLLGSCVLRLAEHPELRKQLAADPARQNVFIEEMLRLESPIKYSSARVALCDVNIGGVDIPRGQMVTGLFGAANRDPSAFEAPDELRWDRKGNPHLGFGFGKHYCVGAHFARLQLRIALDQILTHWPAFQLISPRKPWWKRGASPAAVWRSNPLVRGLQCLHIEPVLP